MKRKDTFLLQNVGGASLLVPLGAQVVDMNGIVTLNDTGRHLWELLTQDRSPEDLAAVMVARFDVDRERALADVRIFLDELMHMGLLEA